MTFLPPSRSYLTCVVKTVGNDWRQRPWARGSETAVLSVWLRLTDIESSILKARVTLIIRVKLRLELSFTFHLLFFLVNFNSLLKYLIF